MPDNNQNQIDLPEGILIKTGKGQFKKVQAGKISEVEKKKEGKTPLKSPDFYYHADDEEEIKLQKDKLEAIEREPTISKPETITEQIIQKHNLDFPDEIVKKRFFNIIKSRLVDVRDSIETEEILMRSTKIGGMDYDKDLVYKIMQDVESEAEKIQEFKGGEKSEKEKIFIPKIPKVPPPAPPPTQAPPSPPPPPVTTEDTEVIEAAEKKQATTEDTKAKKDAKKVTTEAMEDQDITERIKPTEEIPYIKVKDITVEAKPELKKVEKIKEIEKFEKKIPEKEPPRKIKKEEKPIRPPLMPRVTRPSFEEEEEKVTDIKTPKKVIGPVEELSDLSLTDFRRLGKNLDETIEKIKQKIELLEEESFSLKTQGIEAWRNSQVNKLYLDMGRESIEKNQPIKTVMEGRKRNNLPYLTNEEFIGVADLNKHLNY